ncbi:hypothetical protein BJY24_001396 [Nocardia transvalensis]|uniref:Uncharacterized protein n=1 Tax=Nocardia transvalensis TaxID=37333 RepID=A0A7W9UGQ2_9NOCA|nr:hypothetical protein [Nocardia transvalensis]MBB5912529.1 hypothetical protein [Nocardia transvalensis]
MSDSLHTRICLTGAAWRDPMISLFLVPEPRVRGACMLHLLEQAPVDGEPRRDPDLIASVEARHLPGARPCLLAYGSGVPRPGLRTLYHDHYIGDGPVGLDTGDPDEVARLALLPERAIGPRRIDDFEDYSVRWAMLAVYRYFGVDQRIPLMYHGFADPRGGWLALRTAIA